MKKLCMLMLTLGLWAGSMQAQSPWLSDARLSSVSLEWDKPLFDSRTYDRDDVTVASSVLFLTGRARLSENFRLVAELPLSHFGLKRSSPFSEEDNTQLGNIYVGGIYDIHTTNPDNHAFVELGARIPTTPEITVDKFGQETGFMSEIDRREAFWADTWSIPLIGNYLTTISGPFAARLRLGTAYDIYVDDLENLDNELHLLYGVTGLYRQPKVEAHLAFMGRNQYVGNNVDFGDSGFTQLRAGVARPFRNIVPGVYVRKPLGDNYNELVDWAFGFNIEFRANQPQM